jgi:hypothetical protein
MPASLYCMCISIKCLNSTSNRATLFLVHCKHTDMLHHVCTLPSQQPAASSHTLQRLCCHCFAFRQHFVEHIVWLNPKYFTTNTKQKTAIMCSNPQLCLLNNALTQTTFQA